MNEEEENNNDNNDNNHKIHDNNNNNNIVVVVDVKALEERVTKKLEQLIVRIRNVENDKRDAKESYEEKQMELNQLETMTIEKRRVKALMKRAALKLLKTRSSLNRIMIEDIYNDNHKKDDDNDNDNDIDNDIDNEEESGDEEMIFFRNEKVRLIEEAKSYRDEYDEKDIEVKKLRNTMNDIITLINNCKHSLETTNDDDVVERRRNNNNDTPGNNSSKTATATATAPATSPTMVKV